MKVRILTSAIIFCCCLVACKPEKAKRYSDVIVKKQQSVDADIAQATKKLQTYFITDEIDSIVRVSGRMEDEITATINDIKTTKTPKLKEAENFRDETLKYLEYRKNLFENYRQYGLQTTPQGREKQRMYITAVQGQEKIFNHNLQAAQINFVKANHVKIKQ